MSGDWTSKRERIAWGLTANLPGAFVSLATAAVTIITLGYFVPPWEFRFIAWRTRFKLQRRIARTALSEDSPE